VFHCFFWKQTKRKENKKKKEIKKVFSPSLLVCGRIRVIVEYGNNRTNMNP